MRNAIQQVLMNDGFKIPSPSAKAAVETAEKLLEWCSQTENNEAFGQFTLDLLEELETCFKSCCRSLQRRREKMWNQLIRIRTSPEFRAKWSTFLSSSISVTASPIFYEFVVDSAFNTLLKKHHKIDMPEEDSIEVSLDYEEKNSLRYTAGFVTRSLIKKLKRSNNPQKDHLITCLQEINTTEEIPGDTKDESEDWIDILDRGGTVRRILGDVRRRFLGSWV